MKLYNNTKLDNNLLEKVIYDAAKKTKIGVRTGNVIVRVITSSKYVSGYVSCAYDVSKAWLEGRKTKGFGVYIKTDIAYIVLRIPVYGIFKEIEAAKSFFEVAAHEWKHIADFQKNKKFVYRNPGSLRQMNWTKRPQEKRAVAVQNRAKKIIDKRLDIQDSLLDLAINIEELRKA